MAKYSAEKHYKYFTKDKSGYYITKDIYNKRGMLLIRKGQKVSSKVMSKLMRLKNHDPEILDDRHDIQGAVFDPDNKQRDILTPTTKEFGAKMNISDYHILEKPNKVLNTIIFESKTEPWWIYVNALGNYVDWLYTHSIDVAIISMMMAERLGYGDEELYNIGFGALLHDVGKLLVPKSILEKPESLTDMERFCIRQHCELGVSSLEGFNIPKEFMDMVMQHHERLDGSGYPKGLKEDEIGLNAKIAMVADAVDAITSYRPYRGAQNMDAAIKMLRDDKEKYPQELVSLLEKILK
ncbi:MAG: HD-GYP domain-containing protein [Anaerovoracaceae bacterium]|jgi:putative nucleotidyltransferase with HDIG domain